MQWNELKQQPEIVEAIERIEKRKKQEAEERKRQEAECKRDEQTRQSRFLPLSSLISIDLRIFIAKFRQFS